MNAIAQAGQSFPVLLAQGPKPFIAKIRASQSISAEITGLTGELGSFVPQTVSDASALSAAYANAIDALSLSRLAGFAVRGAGIHRAAVAHPGRRGRD